MTFTKNLWVVKAPFNSLFEIWQQTHCEKSIFHVELDPHATERRTCISKAYVCSTTH